jgi:hypothetical protein
MQDRCLSRPLSLLDRQGRHRAAVPAVQGPLTAQAPAVQPAAPVPFSHVYDESLDGGLVLPRGMLDTVTDLAA